MDLFSTMRVLARRWYVVLPVLALAVVGELLLPSRIPASYRWSASVLLEPPAADGATRASNPYLNFDQSLIVASNVLARGVSDPATAGQLARAGYTAHYAVNPPVSDIPNPSPIVEVVVQDLDRAQVVRTGAKVVATLQESLRDRQRESGAPAGSFIKPVVVSESAAPEVVLGNRHRAAAALAALAVILLTVAAFLAEALAERRRPRVPRLGPVPVDLPPSLVGDAVRSHGLVRGP